MPAISMERLLKQLLEAGQYAERHHADDEAPARPVYPMVAIACDYGSAGEPIGIALARLLGVHFLGDDLGQAPSETLNLEEVLLQRLEEEGRRRHQHRGLLDFLGGSPTTMPAYRRHLIDALLVIAEKEGAVVMNRAAHVFLRDRPVFRLRLIVSENVGAERVARRASVSLDEARIRIQEINEDRRRYQRALLGREMLGSEHFDLTLNTDRMTTPEAVAEALVQAMRALGLPTSRTDRGT
ncbi:MAG: AAA family ATPase [Pseudomonadota bacterium]